MYITKNVHKIYSQDLTSDNKFLANFYFLFCSGLTVNEQQGPIVCKRLYKYKIFIIRNLVCLRKIVIIIIILAVVKGY